MPAGAPPYPGFGAGGFGAGQWPPLPPSMQPAPLGATIRPPWYVDDPAMDVDDGDPLPDWMPGEAELQPGLLAGPVAAHFQLEPYTWMGFLERLGYRDMARAAVDQPVTARDIAELPPNLLRAAVTSAAVPVWTPPQGGAAGFWSHRQASLREVVLFCRV